jgi:glycosyltransferase involved in cell wall biosynthesis
MNGVLLEMAKRVDVELLFSQQWLGADGKLPENCPLRELSFQTFPQPENLTERLWKLTNWPKMDRHIADDSDWVYCPMETRLPVTKCLVAVTIHDIQAFETDLPWSNTPEHRRFRRKWATWIHKTLKESRVVFTVSEFSKRRMVDLLGADPNKIVVSGNGIDVGFLGPEAGGMRPESGGLSSHASGILPQVSPLIPQASNTPYILIVGGLRHVKGGRETLEVAKACAARFPELRFLIAGPNDRDLEDAARALGNFEFPGWVEDAALPALYAKASALLFLSHYEGYGIPAIEAMAMGTPAVVADCASLPEVVDEHGFVVDPKAADLIAEILCGLANGSVSYDVAAGKAYARNITWGACAQRVETALAAML